jgi:hypothetical protein
MAPMVLLLEGTARSGTSYAHAPNIANIAGQVSAEFVTLCNLPGAVQYSATIHDAMK